MKVRNCLFLPNTVHIFFRAKIFEITQAFKPFEVIKLSSAKFQIKIALFFIIHHKMFFNSAVSLQAFWLIVKILANYLTYFDLL